MDAGVILNWLSLGVAILALAISGRLAYHQVETAEHANLLPVILDLFARSREPAFLRAQQFARERLADAYPPEKGLRGIPDDALREELFLITWFYDDLGKLVAHSIVPENVVLGAFGDNIVRTWQALMPYLYRERELRQSTFQAYFEDLAVRARNTPPREVHQTMRLRRWT